MARAAIFARLGFLVVRDFLDTETCARIRTEVSSAKSAPAEVRGKGPSYVVDREVRQTNLAEVSDATRSLVEARLLALMPAAAEHFGTVLTGSQPASFLLYRQGDFYRAHRDSGKEPDPISIGKERQISLVIFLNGEAQEPGEGLYGGGALTFYGITDDPRGKTRGFPLTGEAGLLIAFRSEVVHEVAPVLHGERYTVVSWFV